MRQLIESTFVTLGGDISAPQDWGPPYINCPDGEAILHELLFGADALLLGRKTYEGLSQGYLAMGQRDMGPLNDFVARMNAIPKYVASTTLESVGWNAQLLAGDVAEEVRRLKQEPGSYLLKYGTGPLDRILLDQGLIDEVRIWLVPVTNPPGQRLFEDVGDMGFRLSGTTILGSGTVVLRYVPA